MVKRLFPIFLAYLCSLPFLGCVGLRSWQARPLPKIPKLVGKGADKELEPKRGDMLYQKQTEVGVTPLDSPQKDGSLFDASNTRMDLYGDRSRFQKGRLLRIAIALPSKDEGTANPNPSQTQAEKDTSRQGDEDALMKEFPELTPPEGKQRIKTELPMTITEIFPNGDVMVSYERESMNTHDHHLIKVTGKLPYSSLIGSSNPSTNDLFDVHMTQVQNRTTSYKNSLVWENDYTLRVSDFREAGSQEALDLEEKRKKLLNLRDQLVQRMQNTSKERQRFNDEKKKLASEQEDLKRKIELLQTQAPETTKKTDDTAKTTGDKTTNASPPIATL